MLGNILGIVVHVVTHPDAVQQVTQSCADAFGRAIVEHTQDWHMMQRVFVEDLNAGPTAPDGR